MAKLWCTILNVPDFQRLYLARYPLCRSYQTLSVTLLGEVLIRHLNLNCLGGGDWKGKDRLMHKKFYLFKKHLRWKTKLIRMKLA